MRRRTGKEGGAQQIDVPVPSSLLQTPSQHSPLQKPVLPMGPAGDAHASQSQSAWPRVTWRLAHRQALPASPDDTHSWTSRAAPQHRMLLRETKPTTTKSCSNGCAAAATEPS